MTLADDPDASHEKVLSRWHFKWLAARVGGAGRLARSRTLYFCEFQSVTCTSREFPRNTLPVNLFYLLRHVTVKDRCRTALAGRNEYGRFPIIPPPASSRVRLYLDRLIS